MLKTHGLFSIAKTFSEVNEKILLQKKNVVLKFNSEVFGSVPT